MSNRIHPDRGPEPVRREPVDVSRELLEASDETRLVGEHLLQTVAGSMAAQRNTHTFRRGIPNRTIEKVFRRDAFRIRTR